MSQLSNRPLSDTLELTSLGGEGERRVVIVGHKSPDGDCIGCLLYTSHDLRQKHNNEEDLVLLMGHGFTMRVLEALLQGGPLDKVEEITFLPNGDYRLYEGGKLCQRPRVVYISGGQRSGKSGYAQRLALSLSDRPIYLATARHWDEDF